MEGGEARFNGSFHRLSPLRKNFDQRNSFHKRAAAPANCRYMVGFDHKNTDRRTSFLGIFFITER